MVSSNGVKTLALVACLLCGPTALLAADSAPGSAHQWLDYMSTSMRTLDYDGTFVYYHDGKLEAMRIVHQAGAGGEKERLMSLTGSAREVLRDDKVVTCIMPDNRSVMVNQSRPRQPFPRVPDDLASLSPFYILNDAGNDRVAGLMTRVIAITPRDQYRYGYRFWIDSTNNMLLRYELNDVNGDAIEQVMFTSMQVGSGIQPGDLEPSLTGEGYNWYRTEEDTGTPAAGTVAAGVPPQWQVRQLPAGYALTETRRQRVRRGGEYAEHLIFSDGLATASVYVEKLMPGSNPFTGLSSMGALNAYGHLIDDYQVTVVGEVPAATVQDMALSVARQN